MQRAGVEEPSRAFQRLGLRLGGIDVAAPDRRSVDLRRQPERTRIVQHDGVDPVAELAGGPAARLQVMLPLLGADRALRTPEAVVEGGADCAQLGRGEQHPPLDLDTHPRRQRQDTAESLGHRPSEPATLT